MTVLSNIVTPSNVLTTTNTATVTNKTLTSPILTTPTLGVATATSLQGIIGNVTPAAGSFTTVTASTAIGTASGGTGLGGATPFTANGVVFASSTSALTTGSVLSFDGTNLGIGTNSPSAKLDITSASAGFSNIKLVQTGVRTWAIENTGTSGLFKIIEAGVSDRLVIDASGNLGIGTSSPVAKNHIKGSGTSGQVTASWILENSSSGTAGMDITGTAGASRWRYLYGNGPSTGTNTLTEAMCILTEGASAGNVGIGTSSPSTKLTVYNTTAPQVTFDNGTSTFIVGNNSGGNNKILYGTGLHPMIFYTNATEAMRIDSDGKVGIGTSSPTDTFAFTKALDVNGSSGAFVYVRNNGSATNVGGIGYSGTDLFISNKAAGNIRFFCNTDATERARITSGGELLVGATSNATPTSSTSMFVVQSNFRSGGTYGFGSAFNSSGATGADHYYISFNTATTTQRGYIYYNDGAGQVQLSATSDARLKENIVDAPDALPVLEQVRVRQYNWKETGNTNIGFVAQELYEVIPRAVGVGQDNEDGSIQRAWGVDNASLVPYLVKAIQEQQALIQSLKARLDAANL